MKPASLHGRRAGACAGVPVCLTLMLLSPSAARSETPERPMAVIPAGQEALFAAMLGRGAALPARCTFEAGQIERGVVRGVYKCAGREVVVELRHPSAATSQTLHTEKIAIVTAGGAPPAALLAALEKRIREREGAFDWVWPKPTTAAKEAAPEHTASQEAAAKDAAPAHAAPEDAAAKMAAAKEVAPYRPRACGPPAGTPGILSSYAPDCYPVAATVLVGIAQTMVIVVGLGYGLVRLHRTPSSSS